MKKITIWIVALLLLSLTIRIAREWEYKPETKEPEVDKLGLILDKLAMCESSGNPEAVNPQDGGSRSVGILQFKDSTFVHYAKRYNVFPYAEDDEIINFIYDEGYQKFIARKMLEESIDNLSHWKNCTKKQNLKELAIK